MRKKNILALFPLADDVVVDTEGRWIDIGSNAKRRIDDTWGWADTFYYGRQLVWIFAAGTDRAHESGETLAKLAYRYALEKYGVTEAVVNDSSQEVCGTKSEIIWGLKKLIEVYPLDKFNLTVVFGTQEGHMERVEFIVRKFGSKEISCHFEVTGQTKPISYWHEMAALVDLIAGIHWLINKLQQLRG